jgi:hypothetical protein
MRSFGIGSASTKGDLLALNPARTTRPDVSTDSQMLGVGMHDSSASLPSGQMLVAIPQAGAEAFIDVPAGIGASDVSFGQVYGIYGSGAKTSSLTLLTGSHFSRLVTVEGDLQTSQASRIKVSFRQGNVVGSSSSLTFAS